MDRSCRIVSNDSPLSINKLFTKKKENLQRNLQNHSCTCAPHDPPMFYRVFVVFLLLPSSPSENR